MTAKSFFYASAGIFLLVAAYTLGARHANADFDLAAGPVIGLSAASAVLRADGTVWELIGSSPPRWIPMGCGTPDQFEQVTIPPGVSLSDIVFWNQFVVITRNGTGWYRASCNQWSSAGQIPLPAVFIQGKTWSGVKEAYRE